MDGVIVGNLIRRNDARFGAGLGACDGTIRHNTITENSAEVVISGGEVHGFGGGLHLCHGLIEWNTITENWAHFDGGGLRVCGGTIRNNVILGNSAGSYGGGLHDCDGTIYNNTITVNSASKEGGGLHLCHGTITNNVVWGNTAAEGFQFGLTSMPTYCCIQGWTGGGEGNTDRDPRFVDRDGADNDLETFEDNDYRLSPGSPCIDAGDDSVLHTPHGFDMDGNLRIAFGEHSLTVDMGPYDYNSAPLNVRGILSLGSNRIRLTWNSQPNDSYIVWSCLDLPIGHWVQEATLLTQGSATEWTDPAAIGQVKFYRVEMGRE